MLRGVTFDRFVSCGDVSAVSNTVVLLIRCLFAPSLSHQFSFDLAGLVAMTLLSAHCCDELHQL